MRALGGRGPAPQRTTIVLENLNQVFHPLECRSQELPDGRLIDLAPMREDGSERPAHHGQIPFSTLEIRKIDVHVAPSSTCPPFGTGCISCPFFYWINLDDSRRPEDQRVTTEELAYRSRPARGKPAGALILFHGRGADEHDLFPLLDALDPSERLVGATPRGPLSLPPGGAHWYVVKRVGYPDPATFTPTFAAAGRWLDTWLEGHGLRHDQAILGGFSQGAVMSFALGLGGGRPRPAGTLALSGFIPEVDGWNLDANNARDLPIAIGHGLYDPVIEVGFGRAARDRAEAAGARVLYRESPIPHTIDPGYVADLRNWVQGVLPG